MSTSVMWFRRDLRLADHPALLAAASRGEVVPLLVLDEELLTGSGSKPTARFLASAAALAGDLQDRFGARLVVRSGDPELVVPQLAREVDAEAIFVTKASTPAGVARDDAVAAAVGDFGCGFERVGSAYAIGPGSITKADGSPYAVFTPFFKAWQAHGWPEPAAELQPGQVRWARDVPGEDLSTTALPYTTFGREVDQPGEDGARKRWKWFCENALEDYRDARNMAGVDGTSQLSAALRFGEIHPRTLLADMAHFTDSGAQTFRSELCWREFYADVLWHNPASDVEYLRPTLAGMDFDAPGDLFELWKQGRTGYPFVDAGMRQLLAEGWMHNRVRMVTASFLIKDLHIEWQHGERWFAQHLRDYDVASNAHGWQWVAGCGTDASPYFRVFNPVLQGLKFDPDGDYVRRYIPELAHIAGSAVHEPWKVLDGNASGYPEPCVDHAEERKITLERYAAVKAG